MLRANFVFQIKKSFKRKLRHCQLKDELNKQAIQYQLEKQDL